MSAAPNLTFTEAVEAQIRVFTASLSKTLSDEFQKEFQSKVLSAFGTAPAPAKAKGKRGRPAGAKNKPKTDAPKAFCSAGDSQPVLAKGLCRKHYYENRRKELAAGTAVKGKRGRPRKEAAPEAPAGEYVAPALPPVAANSDQTVPAPF